jgi:nucleoside-diphosphate-sugar epimerase
VKPVITVLVTGAGGHVGRRLVHRLAADGIEVRALVRRPSGPWPDSVDEVVGDVAAEPRSVMSAADGVDAIIHLAGAGEAAFRADPVGAQRASIEAASHVAAAGAPLVVYLSTVHVYGASEDGGGLITESRQLQPRSPYAAARAACEDVIKGQGRSIIFRLTNGLGAPRHPSTSGWQVVSNDLCRMGVTQGRLRLRSAGEQWRDFVPLVDVETALSTLVRRPTPPVGTFNFGSGSSITVRALAEEIQDVFAEVTGTRPRLEMPPIAAELGASSTVDVGALRALDLFVPTTRRVALDGVVAECLARRDEFSALDAVPGRS